MGTLLIISGCRNKAPNPACSSRHSRIKQFDSNQCNSPVHPLYELQLRRINIRDSFCSLIFFTWWRRKMRRHFAQMLQTAVELETPSVCFITNFRFRDLSEVSRAGVDLRELPDPASRAVGVFVKALKLARARVRFQTFRTIRSCTAALYEGEREGRVAALVYGTGHFWAFIHSTLAYPTMRPYVRPHRDVTQFEWHNTPAEIHGRAQIAAFHDFKRCRQRALGNAITTVTYLLSDRSTIMLIYYFKTRACGTGAVFSRPVN